MEKSGKMSIQYLVWTGCAGDLCLFIVYTTVFMSVSSIRNVCKGCRDNFVCFWICFWKI